MTQQFWERVFYRNLDPTLPPNVQRCLGATNLAIALHFISTLPYLILFSCYSWELALMVLPLQISLGICYWLMGRSRFDEARILLITALTGSIFVFCMKLSYESGLENTLLYFLVAPFIFFPVSEWKKLAFTSSLSVLTYLALHLGAYGWMDPIPLSEFQLRLFRNSIMATTATLLLVPFFFLFFAQVRTENRLIAARDAAEAASQAKSTFMALVSHELRTPLNGLMGTLQLIEETALDQEQKDYLGIGRTSGELLQTLISDLLDFTKLEKNQIRLESTPIDLRDVLSHTVGLLHPAAEAKQLSLGASIEEGFPRLVKGDSIRIRQVLLNLIGNAVKYTDAGSVAVHLSVRRTDGNGDWVEFAVSDTGIGIPAEKLPSLFKPFSQAHQGHLGARMGVGLGLTICKKLSDLMEGRIELQSEAGVGSTFRFLFPLIAATEDAPGKAAALDAAHTPRESFSGRVLVVEDVKPNQTVARKMLERLGLEVDVAENGQEALVAFDRTSYLAIFMDCQMPVMDGMSATRAIRKREAAERRAATPIIALTANAFDDDRHQCQAAGMDGFLSKPLKKAQLVETLRLAVSRRETATGDGTPSAV